MTGWRRPTCNLSSMMAEKADLVTAADVFMYVGALEGIVKTVAGMLAPRRPVRLLGGEACR